MASGDRTYFDYNNATYNNNGSNLLRRDEIIYYAEGANTYYVFVAIVLFVCFVLCPLGILTNIITLIVIVRNELPKVFKGFLLGLTVSDLLTVASFLFAFIIKAANIPPVLKTASVIACRIGRGCSGWFTVLLTMERYLAVCHPLSHKSTWTQMKFFCAVAIAIFLAVAFSLPHVYNLIVYQGDYAPQQGYFSLTLHVAEFLITAITVMTFNICIISEIRQLIERNKVIQSTVKLDKPLANLTKGIVYIYIIVFVLPNILLTIIRCLDISNYYFRFHFHFLILNMISLILNASINWILYCAVSKKLRTQYYQLILTCICCRQNNSGKSENATKIRETDTSKV